jgi:hypothetical protein
MKVGKIIELEDVLSGWSPVIGGVAYTDKSGARVFIPEKLLVRLYEGLRYHHEQNSDETWSDRCDRMFAVDANNE